MENNMPIKGNNNNVSNHNYFGNNVEKSKKEGNWLVRGIVLGLIGMILSVWGYYLKKNMDDHSRSAITIYGGDGVKKDKK